MRTYPEVFSGKFHEIGTEKRLSVGSKSRDRLARIPGAIKASKAPPRKPRSDAQRNRERILEVAKQAFTRSEANTSLDDVAKAAGVGAGTLYRHFPTRDALLEAVYRTEVERLAAAQQKFAETMPPVEALRAWMLLFVDYIAAKADYRAGTEYARRWSVKTVRRYLRMGR